MIRIVSSASRGASDSPPAFGFRTPMVQGRPAPAVAKQHGDQAHGGARGEAPRLGHEHDQAHDFVLLDSPIFFIKDAIEYATFEAALLKMEDSWLGTRTRSRLPRVFRLDHCRAGATHCNPRPDGGFHPPYEYFGP